MCSLFLWFFFSFNLPEGNVNMMWKYERLSVHCESENRCYGSNKDVKKNCSTFGAGEGSVEIELNGGYSMWWTSVMCSMFLPFLTKLSNWQTRCAWIYNVQLIRIRILWTWFGGWRSIFLLLCGSSQNKLCCQVKSKVRIFCAQLNYTIVDCITTKIQ